jgi:hypothetical protein
MLHAPASETRLPFLSRDGVRAIGEPSTLSQRGGEGRRAALSNQVLLRARAPATPRPSGQGGLLQRQCACGGSGGACEACRENNATLGRATAGGAAPAVAPPIVHEVLRSAARPLDATTRAVMEPRFGQDFGDVRVHADGRAAESARAVNGLAYAAGRDVVFGAGQYAPETEGGRRLLAHELTHVVQQGGAAPGARPPQDLAVGEDSAPCEQEASRVSDYAAFGDGGGVGRASVQQRGAAAVRRQAKPGPGGDERAFVQSTIDFLETSADAYRVDLRVKGVAFDDAKLRRQLGGWKSTFDGSQAIIDSALGKDAVLTQRLRSAYQGAVSAAVAFAADRLGQTRHAVYQTYRDLIAEWALPQAAPEATADKLSDALPEAERHKLTVITAGINFSVDDLFSTKGAKTTIPLPAGVTVRFSGGVPANLRDGLQNVAGTIIPDPLVLNSTMTLSLDPEPYGGDYAAYRFTYVEHKPNRGKPTQEVLIERLGAIGLEGLGAAQAAAAKKKFDAHGFQRGSGWSAAEFASLLAAVAQVPDAILSPVDGVTFASDTADPKDPQTAGNYNPDKYTITIFDRAFPASLTRFGEPRAGVSNDTVRAVTHEIGHAVDLLPLRQADVVEQKQQALQTAFAHYEDPAGSGTFKFPSTEQARFNKLSAAITAAEKALLASRSESGERFQKDASGGARNGPGGDGGRLQRVPQGGAEGRRPADHGLLQQGVAGVLRGIVFSLHHGPGDAAAAAPKRVRVLQQEPPPMRGPERQGGQQWRISSQRPA